ncbi:uncharacterized protein METZ01_LOCUS5913 [marine metagenome]|uniref:Uncharacterized protein n=1 Tax=marine metagenome TaxID=408172 RepID=A0A381NF77_9ZZZZ
MKPKGSKRYFLALLFKILVPPELPGCEPHIQAVTVLSYSVSEVCAVCQPGFLLTGISKAFP